jgi:hypothetical protein
VGRSAKLERGKNSLALGKPPKGPIRTITCQFYPTICGRHQRSLTGFMYLAKPSKL